MGKTRFTREFIQSKNLLNNLHYVVTVIISFTFNLKELDDFLKKFVNKNC